MKIQHYVNISKNSKFWNFFTGINTKEINKEVKAWGIMKGQNKLIIKFKLF